MSRNAFVICRRTVVHPGPVLGAFVSLTGSQLGGAAIGLVFWMIAARTLAPAQVGIGASLVAAMTLFAMFGALGVGTLLLERFKVAPARDRALFTTGLGVAGAGAATLAAGWLLLSSLIHIPGALGGLSLGTAFLLVAATAIASICSTFDLAVMGMGAGHLQLRRNLTAGTVRVAVLLGAIAFGVKGGEIILVAWIVGLLASLLTTPVRRHISPRARVPITQRMDFVRSHWSVAIGHHGLSLAITSTSLIVPVFAASILPAAQVAYFSQARLLADTALALLYLLTVALFASVQSVEEFREKARKTLTMGMILALVIIAAGAVLGRIPLLMFGGDYARNSLPLLIIILLAAPGILIKDLFVVMRRVQGLRRQGAITMGLWGAAELAGAAVGGFMGGLTMLCVGGAVMTTVCALIALPVLLRGIRVQPADRVPKSGSEVQIP